MADGFAGGLRFDRDPEFRGWRALAGCSLDRSSPERWYLVSPDFVGRGFRRMTAIEELNRTILLCRDYVADALSDAEICRCLQSVRVLCVSDKQNVSSHSGQTALVTLVSLLSRMGMQVGLTIPGVGMISKQPPLSGS